MAIDKEPIPEEVVLNRENKDDEILEERRVTKVFRVKNKRQVVPENDGPKTPDNDKHVTDPKQGAGLFYEATENYENYYENYDDADIGCEISFFDEDETRQVSKLTLSSDFTSSYEMSASELLEFRVVDIDIDEYNLIEIEGEKIADESTENLDIEQEAVVPDKRNGDADILEESRQIKVFRVKIKGQEQSQNDEPKTSDKDQPVTGTDQDPGLLSEVKESEACDDVNVGYEVLFFNEDKAKNVLKLTLSSDFTSSYQTSLSDVAEIIVVGIDIDENKEEIELKCSIDYHIDDKLLKCRCISLPPTGITQTERYANKFAATLADFDAHTKEHNLAEIDDADIDKYTEAVIKPEEPPDTLTEQLKHQTVEYGLNKTVEAQIQEQTTEEVEKEISCDVMFKDTYVEPIPEEVVPNKENDVADMLEEKRVTQVYRVKMGSHEPTENDQPKTSENHEIIAGADQEPGLFSKLKRWTSKTHQDRPSSSGEEDNEEQAKIDSDNIPPNDDLTNTEVTLHAGEQPSVEVGMQPRVIKVYRETINAKDREQVDADSIASVEANDVECIEATDKLNKGIVGNVATWTKGKLRRIGQKDRKKETDVSDFDVMQPDEQPFVESEMQARVVKVYRETINGKDREQVDIDSIASAEANDPKSIEVTDKSNKGIVGNVATWTKGKLRRIGQRDREKETDVSDFDVMQPAADEEPSVEVGMQTRVIKVYRETINAKDREQVDTDSIVSEEANDPEGIEVTGKSNKGIVGKVSTWTKGKFRRTGQKDREKETDVSDCDVMQPDDLHQEIEKVEDTEIQGDGESLTAISLPQYTLHVLDEDKQQTVQFEITEATSRQGEAQTDIPVLTHDVIDYKPETYKIKIVNDESTPVKKKRDISGKIQKRIRGISTFRRSKSKENHSDGDHIDNKEIVGLNPLLLSPIDPYDEETDAFTDIVSIPEERTGTIKEEQKPQYVKCNSIKIEEDQIEEQPIEEVEEGISFDVLFKEIDKMQMPNEVVPDKEHEDTDILEERRVTQVFRVKIENQELPEYDQSKTSDKHELLPGADQEPGLFSKLKSWTSKTHQGRPSSLAGDKEQSEIHSDNILPSDDLTNAQVKLHADEQPSAEIGMHTRVIKVYRETLIRDTINAKDQGQVDIDSIASTEANNPECIEESEKSNKGIVGNVVTWTKGKFRRMGQKDREKEIDVSDFDVISDSDEQPSVEVGMQTRVIVRKVYRETINAKDREQADTDSIASADTTNPGNIEVTDKSSKGIVGNVATWTKGKFRRIGQKDRKKLTDVSDVDVMQPKTDEAGMQNRVIKVSRETINAKDREQVDSNAFVYQENLI